MAYRMPPGSSLPRAVQTAQWFLEPYGFFERCRRRYGPTFTVHLLTNPPTAMLTRPEDVKALYTGDATALHAGEGLQILEPLVGRSVLLLDEEEHLRHRKLLLPPFHGERLEGILVNLDATVEETVARWPRDTVVSLQHLSRALTLDVILGSVMGLQRGPLLDTFRTSLTSYMDLGTRLSATLPPLRRSFGPVGSWPRFVQARAAVDRLIYDLIEERRQSTGGVSGNDVLGLLVDARDEDGEPLSDQELRDELMALLLAGHETTSTTIAWAFERLSTNASTLQVLLGEIDSDASDAYLTATVYETMRQRPVLTNTGVRIVKRDVQIGNFTYRAGTGVTANAYLLHHDPEIYPDPYAFRPERFLGEKPGTYTWIPFGGGRRRCIGAPLAIAETKAVLKAVLGTLRVRLRDAGPHRPTRRNVTVLPRGGVQATLAPRAPSQPGGGSRPTPPACSGAPTLS